MKEYSNKPRDQRLKEIVIGQSLVALLIVLISAYLVFWGMGYKINWQTMKITHTGIVYLSFAPKDSEVYFSGQKQDGGSPYDSQLLPGYYDIEIKKTGHNTWKQRVNVAADKVLWFKNIILFKIEPEISVISDSDIIASIDSPYDTLVKNPDGNLSYSDHEIWIANDLVTRLSNRISNVIWYPGSEYLAYQQSDEIRIISRNGTNDVLLVKLSSSDRSNFIFSWDGSALLYKDGIAYKRAIIK